MYHIVFDNFKPLKISGWPEGGGVINMGHPVHGWVHINYFYQRIFVIYFVTVFLGYTVVFLQVFISRLQFTIQKKDLQNPKKVHRID